MVWCGVVWYGVAWCSVVWYGVAWCSVVWYGVAWCSVVWYGVAWCSVVWYDVAWCSVVWYDVALQIIATVSISSNLHHLSTSFPPAPPKLDNDFRDQFVDKGDTLRLRIPFKGTGPFSFKLRRDNKEIPEGHPRIKVIEHDGYVVLQIKGEFFFSFFY